MTDFTSTTSTNAATLSEVAKYVGIGGNSKANAIHRVHYLAQSSVFRGTDIAQAVYTLEWARTTGRFSGEVEMAIRKLSPYQVLKLCYTCKASTMALCLENFKAALAPKPVQAEVVLTDVQAHAVELSTRLSDWTAQNRPMYAVGYKINTTLYYNSGFSLTSVKHITDMLARYGYKYAVALGGKLV